MTAGETMFEFGKQKVEGGFTPYKPGEYDWTVDSSQGHAEIKTSQKEGSVPYVSVRFKLTNEADKYTLFHNFFLNLDPGGDGLLMPNRPNGIVAFGLAVGQAPNVPLVQLSKMMKDGTTKQVACLSSRAVLAWLKSLDGMTFRARIRTSKASEQYDAKSEVAAFIEGAAQEEAGEAIEEEVPEGGEVVADDEGPASEPEPEADEPDGLVPEEEEVEVPKPAIKMAPKATVPSPAAKPKLLHMAEPAKPLAKPVAKVIRRK